MHVSRSLKKGSKRLFHIAYDHDFKGCWKIAARGSIGRRHLDNRVYEDAHNEIHIAGLAHSVEVTLKGELVGGAYGVSLGSMFFGESMFSESTMPRKSLIRPEKALANESH